MSPPILESKDRNDPFRLHYVQGRLRCVVSYDTLEQALKRACKKLAKASVSALWISDAAKQPLLDGDQIRGLFACRRG